VLDDLATRQIYSRTLEFVREFGTALALADEVGVGCAVTVNR
jgi:hypothetical protein